MQHHSATFDLARQTGVSPRTIQRLMRRAAPKRPRTWIKPELIDAAAAAAAIQRGRARCFSQPLRHALSEQMSLFD